MHRYIMTEELKAYTYQTEVGYDDEVRPPTGTSSHRVSRLTKMH